MSERQFDKAFENTLDKLKFRLLEGRCGDTDFAALEEMHRKFHYEVCLLKSELEKAT